MNQSGSGGGKLADINNQLASKLCCQAKSQKEKNEFSSEEDLSSPKYSSSFLGIKLRNKGVWW